MVARATKGNVIPIGENFAKSCGENLFRSDGDSAFRNAVLFFKARFEGLQIYGNPRLRAFRGSPKILHGPRDGLP
jgi:hypothetical protein